MLFLEYLSTYFENAVVRSQRPGISYFETFSIVDNASTRVSWACHYLLGGTEPSLPQTS